MNITIFFYLLTLTMVMTMKINETNVSNITNVTNEKVKYLLYYKSKIITNFKKKDRINTIHYLTFL